MNRGANDSIHAYTLVNGRTPISPVAAAGAPTRPRRGAKAPLSVNGGSTAIATRFSMTIPAPCDANFAMLGFPIN